jgi:hypothetical protein
MKGRWDARRVITPPESSDAPVTTAAPDAPKDTVPVTNSLDGVVVGDDPAWKTFRSAGSVARCHVENGLNSRDWSNARGGIRFSWTRNGKFLFEIANSWVPNSIYFAHLTFEASQLRLGSQWVVPAKNQRKSRFVYDSLPSVAPNPNRILRGQFENVYLTLQEGSKLYTRAVGKVEFSHPGVSGYCNFDLRVSPKSS